MHRGVAPRGDGRRAGAGAMRAASTWQGRCLAGPQERLLGPRIWPERGSVVMRAQARTDSRR